MRNSGYRVDLKFKETQERNDPQDALKAAPASHRLIFENTFVRVLNVIVPPATKEPFHTHSYPGFLLRDTTFMALRYHTPDGKYKESRRQPKPAKPMVLWLEPEPLHAVENTDTITTPAIRIELKVKR